MKLAILWAATALVAGLVLVPSAHAQEASPLSGHWTGQINEPHSRNFPQYTLSVHIDTDRSGRPLGVVEYDAFPCAGVWANASHDGPVWRFEETITQGGDRCSRHVVVELTPDAEGVAVRLWAVGSESQVSTGRLGRRR